MIIKPVTREELEFNEAALKERTPMEVANSLNSLVALGWKQQDIAKHINKSLSFVSAHLYMLALPACVMELYTKNICNNVNTLNNLRILYGLSPERCIEACKLALINGITHKRSKELLKEVRETVAVNTSSAIKEKTLVQDMERKFNLITALATLEKPTLNDLIEATGIPGISVKRNIAALRDEFKMNIVFYRTGKKGASGYYILMSWGIIDRNEFLSKFG